MSTTLLEAALDLVANLERLADECSRMPGMALFAEQFRQWVSPVRAAIAETEKASMAEVVEPLDGGEAMRFYLSWSDRTEAAPPSVTAEEIAEVVYAYGGKDMDGSRVCARAIAVLVAERTAQAVEAAREAEQERWHQALLEAGAAVEAAVALEREACARVAEESYSGAHFSEPGPSGMWTNGCAARVAAAIRARASAFGANEAGDGHEPGEVITATTCPCCSAALSVEYGDDPGQVVVVGTPASEGAQERTTNDDINADAVEGCDGGDVDVGHLSSGVSIAEVEQLQREIARLRAREEAVGRLVKAIERYRWTGEEARWAEVSVAIDALKEVK